MKKINNNPIINSIHQIDRYLFDDAKRYLAGGVNSPVRSFKAVGGEPIFINRAKGSMLYGDDGREFIDYCLSWGAMILGHAHPRVTEEVKKAIDKGTSFGTATVLETALAKMIIEAIPSIENLRLTSSGTEAAMSALRLARAFTKKDKVIKFEGAYHGHADYLLASDGVPKDFMKHTLTLPYNDIEKLDETVKIYKDDLAAIIVEPVAGNMGVVLSKEGFLKELRTIAERDDIVLIFDEVITGFRVSYGGAQRRYNVRPDLTCLGKIIGGGFPVGAFGGRKDIMKLLAPEGAVYQAGTFSGNPITVTAGIATLEILKNDLPYEALEKLTSRLSEEIETRAKKVGIKLRVNRIASMFSVFFIDKEAVDYNSARRQDTDLFKNFFHGLLNEGIYLSPSGLEANFLSTAHRVEDLNKTINAVDKAFSVIARHEVPKQSLF